jgi:hypothetical protein
MRERGLRITAKNWQVGAWSEVATPITAGTRGSEPSAGGENITVNLGRQSMLLDRWHLDALVLAEI